MAAAPDREQEPDRFGEQASADGFQDLGRGLPAVGLDTHAEASSFSDRARVPEGYTAS